MKSARKVSFHSRWLLESAGRGRFFHVEICQFLGEGRKILTEPCHDEAVELEYENADQLSVILSLLKTCEVTKFPAGSTGPVTHCISQAFPRRTCWWIMQYRALGSGEPSFSRALYICPNSPLFDPHTFSPPSIVMHFSWFHCRLYEVNDFSTSLKMFSPGCEHWVVPLSPRNPCKHLE